MEIHLLPAPELLVPLPVLLFIFSIALISNILHSVIMSIIDVLFPI